MEIDFTSSCCFLLRETSWLEDPENLCRYLKVTMELKLWSFILWGMQRYVYISWRFQKREFVMDYNVASLGSSVQKVLGSNSWSTWIQIEETDLLPALEKLSGEKDPLPYWLTIDTGRYCTHKGIWRVHDAQVTKYASRGIHPSFENRDRCHQKSPNGSICGSTKRTYVLQFFFIKFTILAIFWCISGSWDLETKSQNNLGKW